MFIQAKENQQSAFVRTQYDLKKYESRFLILIQNNGKKIYMPSNFIIWF